MAEHVAVVRKMRTFYMIHKWEVGCTGCDFHYESPQLGQYAAELEAMDHARQTGGRWKYDV